MPTCSRGGDAQLPMDVEVDVEAPRRQRIGEPPLTPAPGRLSGPPPAGRPPWAHWRPMSLAPPGVRDGLRHWSTAGDNTIDDGDVEVPHRRPPNSAPSRIRDPEVTEAPTGDHGRPLSVVNSQGRVNLPSGNDLALSACGIEIAGTRPLGGPKSSSCERRAVRSGERFGEPNYQTRQPRSPKAGARCFWGRAQRRNSLRINAFRLAR